MNSAESAAVAEPPDRRTGLVLFGILDVLFGFQYLIKLITLGVLAFTGAKPNLHGIDLTGNLRLTALLALAPMIFFLSIGIGSAVGRRWARSLSLAFAWVWLAFGSVTAAALLLCLPKFAAAGGEKPPLAAYGLIPLVAVGLPGAYLLFYRSKAVRDYCEWLDDEERWTDRCPIAILVVMLLLVIGANLALGLGFSSPRQEIFLGHVLSDRVRAGFAVAAAFELLLAWRLARRELWAWIGAVVVIAVRCVASIAIAASFTVERLSRFAHQASGGALSPKESAELEALKNLHPTAAITAYIAVLALLELGVVLWAGKWVRGKISGETPQTG